MLALELWGRRWRARLHQRARNSQPRRRHQVASVPPLAPRLVRQEDQLVEMTTQMKARSLALRVRGLCGTTLFWLTVATRNSLHSADNLAASLDFFLHFSALAGMNCE